MDLYEEIYGRPWHFKPQAMVDDEDKITEFNYENFIPAEVLARYDTSTDSFKQMIRKLNFNTRTQIEQSDNDKANFKKLMPVLACLEAEEKRAFIHLLKNERAKRVAAGQECDVEAIREACSSGYLERLA